MRRKANEQGSRPLLLHPLLLVLVVAALLAAAVGSLAWFRYVRSLQTYTKVQIPIYSIVGDGQSTMIVDLGNIDTKDGSEKEFVFDVDSTVDTRYWLQMAHTTNIDFKYEIYTAVNSNGSYQKGTILKRKGDYENAISDGGRLIANNEYHGKTYGSHDKVQKYAEPLYWQSQERHIRSDEIHYFILVVSWDNSVPNDKETDMVYLTVGVSGGIIRDSQNGTGGTE